MFTIFFGLPVFKELFQWLNSAAFFSSVLRQLIDCCEANGKSGFKMSIFTVDCSLQITRGQVHILQYHWTEVVDNVDWVIVVSASDVRSPHYM